MFTEDGRLYRPVSEAGWRVPSDIELVEWPGCSAVGAYDGVGPLPPVSDEPYTDTQALRWGNSGQAATQTAHMSERCLNAFLSLHAAPPALILAFARRYGVIEICKHGLPASHNPPADGFDAAALRWFQMEGAIQFSTKWEPVYGHQIARQVEEWQGLRSQHRRHAGCLPLGCQATEDEAEQAGSLRGLVPLSAWRRLSAQARDILRLAEVLLVDDVPRDPGIWRTVMAAAGGPPGAAMFLRFDRANAQALVWHAVNYWLQVGNVRPRLIERNAALALELTGTGLFASLAMQLALAATTTEGLARCSACGAPYIPTRKPVAGRRSYCQTCGSRAARRDATQMWRWRKLTENAADAF